MIDDENFRRDLHQFLVAEFDDEDLVLSEFARCGEGLSWDTYMVGVGHGESDRAARRFAVKRAPATGMLSTGARTVYGVAREVELLAAAADAGCPVPRVHFWNESDGDRRGFYGMDVIEGEVPLTATVAAALPKASDREAVGAEIARLMALLHKSPPQSLGMRSLPTPPAGSETGPADLAAIRAIYDNHVPMREPLLDLAFAWLEHRADAVSGRVALVHNDLRIGNVVVRGGRVAAILDWETATFTDPACDIAKFALPPFRAESGLASGLISQESFLGHYERAAGWRPSAETLQYWTVLSLARSVTIGLRTVADFARGSTDDVRYAHLWVRTRPYVRCLVQLFETGEWGY